MKRFQIGVVFVVALSIAFGASRLFAISLANHPQAFNAVTDVSQVIDGLEPITLRRAGTLDEIEIPAAWRFSQIKSPLPTAAASHCKPIASGNSSGTK